MIGHAADVPGQAAQVAGDSGVTDHSAGCESWSANVQSSEVIRATQRSDSILKSATSLIPGGLSTSRFGWFYRPRSEDPIPTLPVMARGKGATVTDIDGNIYIDFIGGHGSMILGHAEDRVVAAITKAVSKGYSFGAPVEFELRLAELVAGRFASIDMLELANTPGDALRSAVYLARNHTGRQLIAVCGGQGSAPDGFERIRFNDPLACAQLFRLRSAGIAAVIVEPIRTFGGLDTFSKACLTALRSLCDQHGALLIFDESITGFRTQPGGGIASSVTPDLTLLGPVIGGGLPLAAIGGKREVMERTPSSQDAAISFGNIPAMAAGIATLQAIAEPGFQAGLNEQAARLDEGLRAASAAVGLEAVHSRIESMVGMTLCDGSSHTSQGVSGAARYARFHEAMLSRGVLLSPLAGSCLFVSAGHTADDIDRAIESAHDAFREIKGAG